MRSLFWIIGLSLATTLAPRARAQNPTVIYGDDNRLDYYQVQNPAVRELADSTVALIRKASLTAQGASTLIIGESYGQGLGLCKDEPFYDQNTAAYCSGFLIAPDLVVTAGHCIYSQATCDNTDLVFGFKIAQAGVLPTAVPTSDVYSCKKVIHSVSLPQGEDFAVVELDRPVTDREPLRYRTSGQIAVGDPVMVIGHPAGLPVKVADGANVRAVQPQFFVSNLDTYGGNSGSAVINTKTGLVEGVLVRGEMDYVIKNNCRTSNRCPNDGCRGEDSTLIKQVLPYIGGGAQGQFN